MDKAGFIFPTIFVLYVAAVLFCCFVRFESLPEVGRSFLGIPADKAAHFLMFLPWPALFSLAFPGMLKKGVTGTIAAIFILGFVFAASTEAGQYFTTYREGDLKDLLADTIGLLVGSLVVPVIKSHSKRGQR